MKRSERGGSGAVLLTLLACIGAGIAIGACSDEGRSVPEGSLEGPGISETTLRPDARAELQLADVRDRLGIASGVFDAREVRFDRLSETHVRPVIEGARPADPAHEVRVALPLSASDPVRLEDVGSSITVAFKLRGAKGDLATSSGLALYEGAGPEGALVVHRAIENGTEDFIVFDRPPSLPSVHYDLELAGAAGLRLVENVFEVLDESGDPRLRISPPYVLDHEGVRHEAVIAIAGCAYDSDPRVPWDRPVTAPGADRCGVEVTWKGANVAYPAVLDPTWSGTGSLITAREAHTAVTFSAVGVEKVLIAGGYPAGIVPQPPLASAEVWSSANGTFTSTGSMLGARMQHGSVVVGGRVLVAGGQSGLTGSTAINTAELYDPGSGTFVSTAQMSSSRTTFGLAILQQAGVITKVLAVGGEGKDAGLPLAQTLKSAEIYAFDTFNNVGTWALTTSLQKPAREMQTVSLTNQVMIIGGHDTTNPIPETFRYDASTSSWQSLPPMTSARHFHRATPIAGTSTIVVTGGEDAGGVALGSVEIFDTALGAWTAAPAMNQVRSRHVATALSTTGVLVVGGGGPYMEIFDLAANQWINFTDPTHPETIPAAPRTSAAAARLTTGLLVTGGNTGTGSTTLAELFRLGNQGEYCKQSGVECASGFCADQVCCNSKCNAACAACSAALKGSGADGTCGSIAAGTDPKNQCTQDASTTCLQNGNCNGSGACAAWPSGTVCGATTCTAGTQTGAACDGLGNAASCVPQSLPCTPYVCSGTVCGTTCANDTQCVSTHYCSTGTCLAKAAIGAVCTTNNQCGSGFCADGYCCNSACGGTCQSCGLSATKGTCGAVVNGDDSDTCTGNNTCDAGGSCKKKQGQTCALGTECASTFCADGYCCNAACSGSCAQCNGAAQGWPGGVNGACSNAPTGSAGSPMCAGGYVCNGAATCPTSCSAQSDCTSGYFCNGSICVQKKAGGVTCVADVECTSTHCTDGVCCDTGCGSKCMACTAVKKGGGADGVCGPVSDGTDPDTECTAVPVALCLNDGQCDGAGNCRDYAVGTSCGTTSCNGNVVVGMICNGPGNCAQDPNGVACAPYQCSGNACVNPCTLDSDCTTGNYCAAGTCKVKGVDGAICLQDAECVNNHCVDGVCCDTSCNSTCEACRLDLKESGAASGACGQAKIGTDPHNSCPDTPSCIGSAAAGFQEAVQQCDAASACADVPTIDCGLYTCAAGACAITCVSDADCITGARCDTGACVPKLDVAEVCSDKAECASGFCVDGVCCDETCAGQCQACDVSGSVGACSPVTGDPHGSRAACDGDDGTVCAGTCDGVKETACTYPSASTECGASCDSGVAHVESCDGAGQCVTGPDVNCGAYVCDGDTCAEAPCAGDEACAPGFHCDAATKICAPAAGTTSCSGNGENQVNSDGSETPCAPYRCVGTTCKSTCVSVDDCLSPNVCDTDGRCIAPPSNSSSSDDGGCSVSPKQGGESGGKAAFFGLLAIAALARRRTSTQVGRKRSEKTIQETAR